MKKRIVCLTLAILMCGSQVVSVMADRESDLREEQAWTSQQLDATYARMSALWDQKQQLESQIESLNSDLVNVMVSIQTLESDIASKEAEIEKTQGDLTKAQNAKDKQYGAMKKRIQYLYEKGGNNAWFQMMLNADNLADLLTRAEYTQQMYEQDRESLQKYARTIEEVQKLEDQYEQEKADFETMKEEYEAQQSNLQYQLDVTRANSADCENEIAYAQQQATEYANLLEQQQAEIEQLEAERIAAEEEARRQAEAEAAAAAAADSSPAADAATRLPGAIRIRKPTVSAGSRARTTALRLRARTAVRAPALCAESLRGRRALLSPARCPGSSRSGHGHASPACDGAAYPPVVATRARLPAHLPERRSPGSNGPVAFDRRAAIKHVRGAVEIRGSRAYRENGRTEAHSDRSGIPRGKFPIIGLYPASIC